MAKEVIALAMGFYNGRRVREGQTFTVADDAKAGWFADVNGPAHKAQEAKAAKAKAKEKDEPRTLSEIAKAAPKSAVDDIV